jgi:hypothetical protein
MGDAHQSARYCLFQLGVAVALEESWSLVCMTLALATRDHVNVPLRNYQHNTLSIQYVLI